LLSTLLTVCLGVLGRHIPWLRFLDVMIGDEPPLSPAQSFYQRARIADLEAMRSMSTTRGDSWLDARPVRRPFNQDHRLFRTWWSRPVWHCRPFATPAFGKAS
jgi:hypothetical protein